MIVEAHLLPRHDFTMSFTTEIVLDCIKAMIFIDIVYHPTELVYILALVSRIISDNVQMLVSWLSRHGSAIFLIIKVSDSEEAQIRWSRCRKFCSIVHNLLNSNVYLTKSKQCVICSLDLFKSSEMQ